METFTQEVQGKYRPLTRLGLGGAAIGYGSQFGDDLSAYRTMEAAWNAGIRYFDTSPYYGIGTGEHRMGLFLGNQPKEEYTLSGRIGRILHPQRSSGTRSYRSSRHNFGYCYDYTAAGTRRSIEDSLQRIGVSALDIVFIEDISPDNPDMKENWQEFFREAILGAMPELSRMKDEGIIRGWGIAANRIEPILKTLDAAEPDIILSSTQYSLICHEPVLNEIFPRCTDRAYRSSSGHRLTQDSLPVSHDMTMGRLILKE